MSTFDGLSNLPPRSFMNIKLRPQNHCHGNVVEYLSKAALDIQIIFTYFVTRYTDDNMAISNYSQQINREFSSELIESPIEPASLHMSLTSEEHMMFCLHIRGAALWKWRSLVSNNTAALFDALQTDLDKIGYELSVTAKLRIGCALKNQVYKFVNSMKAKCGHRRLYLRTSFWARIPIFQDEISRGPQQTISHIRDENKRLHQELEGKKNCLANLKNLVNCFNSSLISI